MGSGSIIQMSSPQSRGQVHRIADVVRGFLRLERFALETGGKQGSEYLFRCFVHRSTNANTNTNCANSANSGVRSRSVACRSTFSRAQKLRESRGSGTTDYLKVILRS